MRRLQKDVGMQAVTVLRMVSGQIRRDTVAFRKAPTVLAVYDNTPWMVDAALWFLIGARLDMGTVAKGFSRHFPTRSR